MGVGETAAKLGLVVAVGCEAPLPVAMALLATLSRPPSSGRCGGMGTAAMPTGRPGGMPTLGITVTLAVQVGVTVE